MHKFIKISIPTPCQENWDTMTSADKGRFCASCQKNVIDFTKSSDREIASVLKNTNHACGRFTVSQLNRDLVIPKQKSSFWMAASAAVISFLTIGNQTISAQTPVNTEKTDLKTDDIIGKVALPKNSITGIVIDSQGMPIPDTNVTIKGMEQGVQTDYDGKFSIEVNQGNILEFTFVGMKPQEITITDKKIYNIVMQDYIVVDNDVFMGAIAPFKHRTFFGRIFHSIGNIFR